MYYLKSLSNFCPISIDLNIYFLDSIFREYKVCIECELIQVNDHLQLSILELNKYEAVLIHTKFLSKESIELTNYEYCHNKLN